MIHISTTKKGKFIVANIAKNGEILKVSETLNSKANAWKNIKAEISSCYNYGLELSAAIVQDNTGPTPKVYFQASKRVAANGIKPEKPYQPK